MIHIFFILNITILLGVSLATNMFDNHLKKISKSIDIFLDPKAYKPKSQMDFISSIVDKYKACENETKVEIGIDVLIRDSFYKQKIGVFNLSTIETVTHKGKQLIWMSIFLMVIGEGVTAGLGESVIHSVLIISSGILSLGLMFFQLYKNIDLEKEKLFVKIQNHLYYIYPSLKAKQKEEQKVILLLNKINVLESQIEELELAKEQVPKEKELGLIENDIIQLIEYFVSPS